MSRVDELIQELCPDGIEYKKISELFYTRNGYTPSKANKEYWENGTIPWFRMEDIRTSGTILSEATQYVSSEAVKGELFPAESIIVATSATIGVHALITVPSLANQRFTYLVLKQEYKEKVNIKFFYYYCFKLDEYCKACLNQGNFASVDMKKFNKFCFPIPPIQVQNEIVRILDSFTVYMEKIKERLYAEIQARKRQYGYYRNQLMNIELDFPKMHLKDIASTFRGEYITKKSAKQGSIPVILGGQEPAYYIDRANHEGEIVVVARSGVSAGFVSYWDEPIFVTDGFGYEAKKTVVIPKYLYYILKNREKEMNGMKRGAGVPHVSGEALSKLEFPIPPLGIQEQIILVNEKLDNEYNELFVTLEAEIELCEKQYEYYRDKLLTFKEKIC